MVALVGALGDFHLAQQRVHLGNAEAPVRVDGRAAGQRAEKLVGRAVEVVRIRIELQIVHDGFDDLGDVLARDQRRNAAQCQACWSERVDIEARPLPFGATVEDGIDLVPLELDHDGLEEMLRGRIPRAMLDLEPFVQDALMGRVHVHQNEPVPILGQDVNPMKLGQCRAERQLRRFRLGCRQPSRAV